MGIHYNKKWGGGDYIRICLLQYELMLCMCSMCTYGIRVVYIITINKEMEYSNVMVVMNFFGYYCYQKLIVI